MRFDPEGEGVAATVGRRLGAIRLSSAPDPAPPAEAIVAALLQAVRKHGLALLPWPEGVTALRARAAFARTEGENIVDLSDAGLIEEIDQWLAPLLAGKRRLDAIEPAALRSAIEGLLGWEASRSIERLAPASFASPAGSTHPIDYHASGGPTVELRPQALYGLSEHPTIAAGRVPLILSLTSPAHRPIQTTRDLPAFWAGSWREVAREMRGRYPRHPWPDDPATAQPTLRTKRASS